MIETPRADWTGKSITFPIADTVFYYTDESLKDGRVGAGIFCCDPGISISFSFGQYVTVLWLKFLLS